jgi:GAF domain-containing protein
VDAFSIPLELQDSVASRLQDMVLETSDAEEFFQGLAIFSASLLSPRGAEIFCNLSVVRHKKPVTVACSTARARTMDELQYAFGDGPGLSAMRTGTSVHVPDVSREHRWPQYIRAVADHAVGSILAVPLQLEGDSTAALNIYASRIHGFAGSDIARAELFAEQSSKTLRLGLRLARLQEARDNLEAAMKGRTAIDVAVGVIMAQNRCSQEAALTVLRKASSSRNAKLRDVAAGVVESVSPNASLLTHFEE